jgi:DNA-binding CsgD family transcriptional regulator
MLNRNAVYAKPTWELKEIPHDVAKPLIFLGVHAFFAVSPLNHFYPIDMSHIYHWHDDLLITYQSKMQYPAEWVHTLDKGIMIVDRDKICYFFSVRECTSAELYHLFTLGYLLKRFIIYLRTNCKKYSPENFHHLSRFQFKPKGFAWINPYLANHVSSATRTSDFIHATPLRQFPIEGTYQRVSLTRRQAELLMHIIDDKTAKEISKIYGVSHRTVEGNILRLKNRFHCQSRHELIEKLIRLGFGVYDKSCQFFILNRHN